MQDPKTNGAWIFISHSNLDFDRVRKVRNWLEQEGHRPIMFYLKCLETDETDLPDLLKREIAARTWFVLCDSSNARRSTHVQQEIGLVKSMEGKVYRVIDLDRLETELPQLAELSKRATVYVSYAGDGRDIAVEVINILKRGDMRVWDEREELTLGSNWEEKARSGLANAAEQGHVLLLLTPGYLSSAWCKAELEYAESVRPDGRSSIIPVVAKPVELGTAWAASPRLIERQWFDLTTGPLEARLQELFRLLKTREME